MPTLFAFANPISNLSNNSANLVTALVVDFAAAIFIAFYLLFSFGVFQVAKGKKEKNPALAFIPFAHLAYFSKMVDRMRWKAGKQSRLFTFSLIAISGCVLAPCLYFINSRVTVIHNGSILIFGALFFGFFIFGLVGMYMAAFFLWQETDEDLCKTLLVFSLIAPLTYAVFVYRSSWEVLRNTPVPRKPKMAEEPFCRPPATPVADGIPAVGMPEKKKNFTVHIVED